MQFLVYLTVLMVSISTVLLEVHWLTSPAPQPKPAVQADERVRGSRGKSKARPRRSARSIRSRRRQHPRRPSSAPQPQPQQSQTSSNVAPAPAAVAANPEPQKPAAETTGVAARAEDEQGNSRTRRPRFLWRKPQRRTITVTCRHVQVPISRSGPPIALISHSRARGGFARRRRCSAPRATRPSARNGANGAGTSRRATASARLDGAFMTIPMKAMWTPMMT